jgi:hypothetical protein
VFTKVEIHKYTNFVIWDTKMGFCCAGAPPPFALAQRMEALEAMQVNNISLRFDHNNLIINKRRHTIWNNSYAHSVTNENSNSPFLHMTPHKNNLGDIVILITHN